MKIDVPFFLFLSTHLLLFYLLQLVNYTLNVWSIHLSLHVLFVLIAGVQLRLWQASIVSIFSALCLSTIQPVAFGFYIPLFMVPLTLVYYFRTPIRRMNPNQMMLTAQAINAVQIIAQALLLQPEAPQQTFYWLRIGSDLLFSQLLLLPVFYWFYSLLIQLLWWTGHEIIKEEKNA